MNIQKGCRDYNMHKCYLYNVNVNLQSLIYMFIKYTKGSWHRL